MITISIIVDQFFSLLLLFFYSNDHYIIIIDQYFMALLLRSISNIHFTTFIIY